MADNFIVTPDGSGTTFRTFEDTNSKHWAPSVFAHATSIGTPDALDTPLAAALADATANPTALSFGSCVMAYNGTTWDRVRGTTTDGLLVNLGSNNDVIVTNAGTFAVQVDGSALTSLQLLDDSVATAGSAITAKGFAVVGTDGTDARIVSVTSAGLVNVADGGGSITVDGTVAATQSGNWTVRNADGAGTALTSATRGSEQALSVQIVDGSGSQVTSFGGGTQYAEDAVHSSGATGTIALAVRKDTAAQLAGTDGDYSVILTDANGRVHVSGPVVATGQAAHGAAVDGNPVLIGGEDPYGNVTRLQTAPDGDLMVQLHSASTALSDNVANTMHIPVNATDSGFLGTTVIPYYFDGAAWDRVRGDATNGMLVNLGSNNTVTGTGGTFPVTDSGGSLTVDAPVGTPVFVRLSDGASAISTLPVSLASVPSHAVTNAGTFAVQVDGAALTALQLIDDPVNTDGSAVGAKGFAIGGTDGTNFQIVSMTAGGLLNIADGSGSLTVDNGGTFAVQVDGTALTRLTDIETNTDSCAVVGNGTAATAQRVTIANDSTGILAGVTTVTTVTTCSTLTGSGVAHDAADSGNPHKIGAKAETALSGITLVADGDRTDLHAGVDGVLITRPHCNLEDIVAGNASDTAGTSTEVIAAAGAGVKIYLTSFTITNTSATDAYCELKSGTTVRWRVSVPAGGGATHSFNVPLPPNAANEAWNFDMGAAVTTAYASFVGFKSKV